jgi:DNA uptake protein ComE-like DNA-binding protein
MLEVYGMDTARAESIYGLIRVDTTQIRKIRLNFDDFRALVRQPYMSYELTKAVVNYRDRKGQIKSFEQLRQLSKDQSESLEKLKYYIDYE